MIDLKSKWARAALDSLNRLIQRYRDILTVFENGSKTAGAIRLLLSGSGARYLVAEDNPRYLSIDGGFGDFDSPHDSSVICRTSANYNSLFKWRGLGKMPNDERDKLLELVKASHYHGRKIRFWATPDRKKIWKELLNAGVDWVNIDRLAQFRKFILSRHPH